MTCRLCLEDRQVDENGICQKCDEELKRQEDIRMENKAIERRYGND